MTFGQRLDEALSARGSLCVGIDPHPGLLKAWELPDDVSGLARFADSCVEAFAGTAAVVKPQSAFFETYGSAGVAVLEETVRACRAAGALVVLDVKRGDIGTTMAAYARAYLDPSSPLVADAITASPYLGTGALEPAFELAHRHDAGVFVLAFTSNPEAVQVQRAVVAGSRNGGQRGGTSVGQAIIDDLAARNAGEAPLGSLGAVVGATIEGKGIDFAGLNGPFLVPGVGAQGGTPDTVRRIFGAALRSVVPSVSREVLRNGPAIGPLRSAVDRLVEQFGYLRT